MLIFCKSFYRQEELNWVDFLLSRRWIVLSQMFSLAQSPVCVSMSCDKLVTILTKAKGTEDSSGCFWELTIGCWKKDVEKREEKEQQEEKNEARRSPPATRTGLGQEDRTRAQQQVHTGFQCCLSWAWSHQSTHHCPQQEFQPSTCHRFIFKSLFSSTLLCDLGIQYLAVLGRFIFVKRIRRVISA